MPSLIPRETIAAIKEKADIVEIIRANVILKERGRNYVGLCPFHAEKTPSFTVTPERGQYYCFGCGASGDAIKYLQEIQGKNFAQTVLDLANQYDIEIPDYSPEERALYEKQISHKTTLLKIVELAANAYRACLNLPDGQQALNYLKGDRQLSLTTINDFKLGYAPDSPTRDRLHQYLLKHGYSAEMQGEAGLIKQRDDGKWVDRFRDRVIVPIYDAFGRPIAFGGRSLNGFGAKYINSPENPLYHKGDSLYGISQARKAIGEQKSAIVVEGYFDVITLHQAGMRNVVAAQGTAFSEANAKLLARYKAERITFNFDSDDAGNTAVDRAIANLGRLIFGGAINVGILRLPDGHDPDSFLKAFSAQDYRVAVGRSPNYFDWQLARLTEGDLSDPETFSKSADQMVKFLRQIVEPNRRGFYLQQCAEILSRGDSSALALQAEALVLRLRQAQTKPTPSLPEAKLPLRQQSEQLALRLYVYHVDCRTFLRDAMDRVSFTYPETIALWESITAIEGEYNNDFCEDEGNVLLSLLEGSECGNPLLHSFNLSSPDLRIFQSLSVMERDDWEQKRLALLAELKTISPVDCPELFRAVQGRLFEAISKIKYFDDWRKTIITED